MDNGKEIHPNTILEGKIINVKPPKRLKQNATFRFIPLTYYEQQTGEKHQVEKDFEGKYSPVSDLNTKTIVKKGALTAGNIFVGSFVSPAVGLVEGAVKNENGNRAKSAVISAYENTPLSYVNKGKEMEIRSGQVFVMSFKLKDEEVQENKPNYSYEIVNE